MSFNHFQVNLLADGHAELFDNYYSERVAVFSNDIAAARFAFSCNRLLRRLRHDGKCRLGSYINFVRANVNPHFRSN